MSECRKICHELLMTDRSERRKAGVKKRRWNVNTFFGVETGNTTFSKGLRSQQVACHSHGQMFGIVRGADFLWLISVSMRIRIPLMEEEEYEAKKLPCNVQS